MNTANDAFLLVFVFVGIALVGQFVVNRFVKTEVLEQSHTAGEAMMGVVGTLFSVLLGFMIASAMTKYQDAQMYGQLEASNVASVFRVARGMSDIDRPRIRKLCRAYVDDVISTEWPLMQKHQKINHGWVTYQELWEAVVATVPENDRQNNLQQGMVASMQALGEQRRARILLASTTMPRALWVVVGIGALITVAFTYVFASQFNHVQGAMTTLVAAALALNIWLLAAYSDPYSGELRISPSMFELVRDSVFTAPDTPSKFLHDSKPQQ
jgi:hypothetical protein